MSGAVSEAYARAPIGPRKGRIFTFTSTQKYVDLSKMINQFVVLQVVAGTATGDGVQLLALDDTSVSGANAISSIAASTTSGAEVDDKQVYMELSSLNPRDSYVVEARTKYLHGIRIGSTDVSVIIRGA